MSVPRRFDHDEAVRLRADGWTWAQIAARFGVTVNAVAQAVRRLNEPGYREHANALSRDWQRANRRVPCACGCGRLVWPKPGGAGLCHASAAAATRRDAPHGTETRYSQGCHCGECRAAAARERRRRRLADLEATRRYDREYKAARRAAA